MIDLPTPRLVVDHVPAEARGWVERALTAPLNRFLQPLADSLKKIFLSQLNVQVVELKIRIPSSSVDITEVVDWASSKFDTPLTITTATLGVVLMGAYSLDSAGHDSGPMWNLPAPVWQEVTLSGVRNLRLRYQFGLTSGTMYRLVYLVVGQ